MNGEKFKRVYDRYWKLVTATAYELLNDYYLAQDVCQEVFLKLTDERLELEDRPEEMQRYLRTVAYHRAIDYYRQMKRRGETALCEDSSIAINWVPEEKLDQANFATTLFQELEKKNADWYYIVIHLCLYDESAEEIARDMGISMSLLRSKYHRAKKWICKNYGSQYDYFK